MSYDFFVFPAEAADDVEEARTVYETARERGPLTAGGPMARFLDALNAGSPSTSDDRFLVAEVRGHDGAAYVCTSWDDPMGNLSKVAGLARPHGLSVYDVQLHALYDPRGGVDVALTTEAGPRLPYLSRTVLHEVVSHLLDRRYQWLEARRGDGSRLLVHRDGDAFGVELRDGALEQPGGAGTADASVVEELVWSWAVGDDRWRTLLDLHRIEG